MTADDRRAAVDAYRAQVRHTSKLERLSGSRGKNGEFIGAYAVNPINQERVPIWVADYVLMGYGDGAVMGVPAHDERDFAFAKKYGLPIKQVIAVEGEDFTTEFWQPWYADKTRGRCVFSVKYDEFKYEEAVDAVARDLLD